MDSPLLVIALKPKVEGMKFRLKTESLIPNGNRQTPLANELLSFEFDTAADGSAAIRICNLDNKTV